MSFAPGYTPTTSFANDETNAVSGRSTVRTVAVDTELANISASITELKNNAQKLQRDDDKLKDLLVEPYALAEQTRALIASKGAPRGLWAAGTVYAVGDVVQQSNFAYICYVAHTAASPFTAAGFWLGISGDGSAAASASAAATSATNAATSATNAASSATTATTQATNASTSATNASNSATASANSATASSNSASAAATSEAAAAASYDSFDDRYLGAKATAPTLDNDGAALLTGALYWDTALPGMRSWNGAAWVTLPAATAASVSNTPAGNIAATTVQAAIDELDAEKAKSGANSDITSLTGLTSALYASGQCQLTKSGANLILLPKNGNLIKVNGRDCTIPDAGVTLAATGLLATTLYYIYAVATAGVITSLEASTTGHSVDTTAGNKGVEIKTGDSTRSLVGMAYVKTAATFADSGTQRFVRSWFNDPGIGGTNQLVGTVSYSAAAYAEISTSIRVEFLTWAGETVVYGLSGTATNNAAGNSSYTGVGFDTTTNPEYGLNLVYTPSASVGTPVGVNGVKTALAEGYHYTTMIGRPDVGTSTWSGTPNAWGCNLSISTKK